MFPEDKSPYHYGILKDISDSMKYNPERAFVMLEEFSNSLDFGKLSKTEFYEYHILLSEARYKCDLEYINEIEIYEAISFLDNLRNEYPKNKELLYQNSRAYYYKGVCEDEKENYKEAFLYYLKSMSLIESINNYTKRKSEIISFKALIYTRLSDILYWLDAYDASINCLNIANNFFAHENNINALVRNNILIGMMYGHTYNYDKTFQHLNKADSLLNQYDEESQFKYVIERISATIKYNMGYREEAFKTMTNQYNNLENPSLKMEAAGVLGDMYYSMGVLDSAVYFYEQYFPANQFSKIDAANHIIEISLKTNNNNLITKYAPTLNDETKKGLQLSNMKTEIYSLYEQFFGIRQNEKNSERILIFLSIILVFTILTFIIGMYLLQIRRGKYHNEIDKENLYIESLQKKFDKKIYNEKHIKQRIENIENELIDIKTRRYLTLTPFDFKLKGIIANNKLCQRLYDISQDENIKTNSSYPELILNEKEQNELISLFNKTYDDAFEKILSEHQELKKTDILYICLYVLGLNEKHISAVTGKTYNIVYNRIKKLQKTLGDKNIREVVKNMLQ